MGKPVSIRDVIGRTLKSLGLDKRVKEAGVVQVWSEAVGEPIDKVTQVIGVRDGVVRVLVDNSVWSQELSLRKVEIIRELNDQLGEKLITDIRFQVTDRRESRE
jgi:predicted nucleic acid-binding Zn ribbon protein